MKFYVHWPFCKSLCPYCDFNSFVADDFDRKAFLQGYLAEIDFYAEKIAHSHLVSTIFFGGGTPSLMFPAEVSVILERIYAKFRCRENLEITLEANPTSSEAQKFEGYIAAGVNRISIGVQSFDEANLRILGRKHSKNEAISAIETAQKFCKNTSFDLMYGVTNQTVEDWARELDFAAKTFEISHISAYNLTIEKGTEFFSMRQKGLLELPKSEEIEKMYQITGEVLENYNFQRYEVSNYAKNGMKSQHNMGYWQIRDYVGIGAGAHGRIVIDGTRFETMNHHLPAKWAENMAKNGNALQTFRQIERQNQVYEILLMGLRIFEGIDVQEVKNRLGVDIFLEISEKKLENFISQGMLIVENGRIAPSSQGISFVNYIVKCLTEG